MKLEFNIPELHEVLKAFNTLTGIRIAVFDKDFNETLSYPETPCSFCRSVRSDSVLEQKCTTSDIAAFEQCRKTQDVYIYKCHAGLVEAAAPLKCGNVTVGYIIFGQITDIKDKAKLTRFIESFNSRYNTDCDISGIKYKNRSQISAAAKLLEMCTNYILFKELIEPKNTGITDHAREYIAAHLGEDIKISDICSFAKTCRTELYEAFKRDLGIGVAAYIKDERLNAAHAYLKSGDMSVSEVADAVGFADYNYFSRVYKQKYGLSPYKTKK